MTNLESISTFWATGDYHAVSLLIADLGPAIVAAAGVRSDHRVLDVGAGSGNATLPAARTGASVTAVDPTAELMEIGAKAAAAEGLDVTWCSGVAEALRFPDASFDVVLSCVGAMFAADQAGAAAELLRVCRPGGTVAMLSWTPAGGAGQLFELLGRHGADHSGPNALAWGDPEHVRAMLGPGCTQLRTDIDEVGVRWSGTAAELAAHYLADFAPVIRTAAELDPAGVDALRRDLTELFHGLDRGPADGPPRYVYEYLLAVGTRAP
mgnify:CR=1 FL=1